ncbi:MAG: AAA family ATPase [Clostridia bacterium]|nr:AAA family ATPase [Clostridia bacterium]
MQLVIDKIKIENFKGTKALEIQFGMNTAIYAQNGVGKTTVADAFYWVLFNKDSAGHAPGSDDFHEKPLDASGNEVHDLETMVELSCRLDDAPFVLKRMQRENWVKKRGQSERTYQGNVSTYWINGVETGANDFHKRISAIADEDTFPMIATMSAFNAADWKKRRAILLSLSGADVDAIMWQKPEYADLHTECEQRGIKVEDIRKVLQDQLRGLRRDADMIPVRIDEASRSIPVVTDEEIRNAEFMVKERTETIEKIDQLIAAEKAGISGGDATQARIIAVNQQMLYMQDDARRLRTMEREKITREIKMREDTAMQYAARLDTIKADLDRRTKERDAAEAEREQLRNEYSVAYSETWDATTISDECPTCGQTLPREQLEVIIAKAKLTFAEEKKAKLERIKKRGQDAAFRVNDACRAIQNLVDGQQQTEEDSTENGKILSGLRDALADLDKQPLPCYDDPHYIELQKEAESLAAGGQQTSGDRIDNLQVERQQAKEVLDKYQAVLLRRDQAEALQRRIEELEAAHREVGDKIAAVEKMIMLAERFITDRCGLLEESINDLFPTLRWKLFNTQINGGITDTCVCLIPCGNSAVTYASSNTASKLHADIEVINVLSRQYGIQLPCFFDNRERVNFVPRTEGQIITLSVSDDEDMRVEIN